MTAILASRSPQDVAPPSLNESPSRPPETIHLENVKWCELTSIGLKVNRQAGLDEMEATLSQLIVVAKGSPLAVGDAMCLGEKRHGDKWAQAVDANKKTGIKIKTLLEYERVSRNIPFSIRLANENVEWSHYQVIADRPKEQRALWIRLVAKHGWSKSELKRAIKEAANPAINPKADDKNYLDPQYKAFLLKYITTQHAFLNECSYEPFKKVIEQTIKIARFQHNRTLASDYLSVKNQVDNGACMVDEIAEEVFISDAEIRAFCIQIVGCDPPTKDSDPREAGTPYEWRAVGVNTEMAKGSRIYGIFPKDSVSGNDFDIPGRGEEHF